MSRFGPPVPYDATAIRPDYTSLPAPVRERIAAEIGGDPVEIRPAGGGFTGGFAARLRSEAGIERFVKAAGPDLPFVVDAYRREARFNGALPAEVPTPELRFVATVEDWTVLGSEAVPGRAVKLPLAPAELDRLLNAWAEASEVLSPVPDALREHLEPMPVDFLRNFTAVAGGQADPFPVPESLHGRLDDLVELESLLEAALTADAVAHGDLRPDNMIVGSDRAWICDWEGLLAAPWFDTLGFLIVAHGDGHDAESRFWKHPTASGVADEQLDSALAAFASYYLSKCVEPPPERVSPHLRRHQRWNGLAAADWLAARRGWKLTTL
ncbi:hypothetical protein GCM10027447_36000 [Glycomyces halotolerans]